MAVEKRNVLWIGSAEASARWLLLSWTLNVGKNEGELSRWRWLIAHANGRKLELTQARAKGKSTQGLRGSSPWWGGCGSNQSLCKGSVHCRLICAPSLYSMWVLSSSHLTLLWGPGSLFHAPAHCLCNLSSYIILRSSGAHNVVKNLFLEDLEQLRNRKCETLWRIVFNEGVIQLSNHAIKENPATPGSLGARPLKSLWQKITWGKKWNRAYPKKLFRSEKLGKFKGINFSCRLYYINLESAREQTQQIRISCLWCQIKVVCVSSWGHAGLLYYSQGLWGLGFFMPGVTLGLPSWLPHRVSDVCMWTFKGFVRCPHLPA